MLFPGKIEKWNIIIDTRSLSETKIKLNSSMILNSLTKVRYAYPYRSKKILVIVPKARSKLWSRLGLSSTPSTFVEETLRQLNLQVLSVRIENLKDLDKFIPPQEREKQYGGQLDDLC
jgi:hypothetical protein